MKLFAVWALKIGKLLDLDGSIWVAQGIVFRIRMVAQFSGNDSRDWLKQRPDHGKNQQCRAKYDETNGDQATAPFLLNYFLTASLTFTLPLSTHKNSLI